MKKFIKATVLSSVLLSFVSAAPVAMAAAKPLTGVRCDGGFFVKTPDKNIHWISEDLNERVNVFSKKHALYAVAECDTGVVSVFQKTVAGKDHYEAFYSPDCKSIGSEEGQTRKIYSGTARINKITPLEKGVEIRLEGDKYLSGESCATLSMQE